MKNSLFLNFLKRAFLVPAIIGALIAGGIITMAPVVIAHSEKVFALDSSSLKDADITKYRTVSYKSFKQLSEGDLVGTVSCKAISLGEKAILYSKSEKSNIVMSPASTEPWKKGGVLIVGSNTSDQFKTLHNVKKGDVFTVSFYDNDSYNYKFVKCYTCVEEKDLNSYIAPDTLVMCLPYNDFTDLGNVFYYRVYVAKLK